MGCDASFGPKETDATIEYRRLKYLHDREQVKRDLTDQIVTNKNTSD